MTLSVPFLLMLLCLIINFGVMSAWKVRTQVNSRYAAWRSMETRTGQYNPPAPFWPTNQPLTSGRSGASLQILGQLWDSDPALRTPVIRGPVIAAPNSQAQIRVKGRLEMDEGLLRGTASLKRNVPVFSGSLPGGSFQFTVTNELIDPRWQFFSMGLSDNRDSRAQAWYALDLQDLAAMDGAISSAFQQVQSVKQELITNPSRPDLDPLDRDPEFWRYRGVYPNFYPRLQRLCSVDPEANRQAVERLNDQIRNVPCRVGMAFFSLYDGLICEIESNCGRHPNAGELSSLKSKRQQVIQFLQQAGCGGNTTPSDCPCVAN